jgi:hypothetical protein
VVWIDAACTEDAAGEQAAPMGTVLSDDRRAHPPAIDRMAQHQKHGRSISCLPRHQCPTPGREHARPPFPPGPMKARRQVGARYVARARGAFGFAEAKGTRNGASLGCAVPRGANVAQHGQSPPANSTVPARLEPVLQMATAPVQDGQPTQAPMQLAWMQGSLRRGRVLPRAQTEDTAAAR